MRRLRVAYVCGWSATELRRAWHTPSQHRQFAHTIRRVAHDWREIIGKNSGQRRKIASDVTQCARQSDNGCLAFGLRIAVAHNQFLCMAEQGPPFWRKRL